MIKPLVVVVVVAASCSKPPAAVTPQQPEPEHQHEHETPEPTSTKSAAFLFPQDGSTVFSDVDLALRVSGMNLKKAGEDPADRGSGHHHVIIDSPSVPAGEPVPADDKHKHFDDGAARVSLRLAPGPHALEMQLADGEHRSFGPALAARIKVTVVPSPAKVGVSFVNLKDGAVVTSPVTLELAVEGFTHRPVLAEGRGVDVLDKTGGHFHVIVDDIPVFVGTTIPDDGTHMRCAGNERELTVPLPPGPHTLTVQLADAAHASYGPRLSSTINVTAR
ncbi:MAG: DUF4399 domain-containing protein [Deltaproteobacteria bacterium]|nr:DUF4399 domain-containing protein [Deltaproteobacteria bacterium]